MPCLTDWQAEVSSVGHPHPTPHNDGSTTIAITLHHSGIVVMLSLLSPNTDLVIVEGPGKANESCFSRWRGLWPTVLSMPDRIVSMQDSSRCLDKVDSRSHWFKIACLRLLSLNRLYTIWSLSVTLATPYSCPLSVLAVAVFCFRANKIMNLSCYPASKVSLLCNTSHCNLVDFEWQCEQILLGGLAMTLPELNHHPTELNHRLWCRIEKVHRDWQ